MVRVPPLRNPSHEPVFSCLLITPLSCSAGLLLPNVPRTGPSWFLAWAGVLTGEFIEFPISHKTYSKKNVPRSKMDNYINQQKVVSSFRNQTWGKAEVFYNAWFVNFNLAFLQNR